MKLLIQRVSGARVEVEGELVGGIDQGLLALAVTSILPCIASSPSTSVAVAVRLRTRAWKTTPPRR